MIPIKVRFIGVLSLMVMVLFSATSSHAQSSAVSQLVSWTCTGSPCDWGNSVSGHALVWPATLEPSSGRLGYTTSGWRLSSGRRSNRHDDCHHFWGGGSVCRVA